MTLNPLWLGATMSMQTRSVLLERKTLQSSIQIGDPEKKAPVRESVEKDSVKKKVVWLDFCGNNDSKEIIGQTTTLQMLQWTGSGSFHLKISLYQLDLYLQVPSLLNVIFFRNSLLFAEHKLLPIVSLLACCVYITFGLLFYIEML